MACVSCCVCLSSTLQEHTSQVSRSIHEDTLEERLQIQFFGDMRRASVKLDGKVLAAKVGRRGCVSPRGRGWYVWHCIYWCVCVCEGVLSVVCNEGVTLLSRFPLEELPECLCVVCSHSASYESFGLFSLTLTIHVRICNSLVIRRPHTHVQAHTYVQTMYI